MNPNSPMILIGLGGAGTAIARAVSRSFSSGMRHLLADTDAASGRDGEPFVLLGGDRLGGRGAGGDVVAARSAVEESIKRLDDSLSGVRLAVIVTALGGGTGGGATIETVKHLADRGVSTIVFATTPFAFEAGNRQRTARGVMAMIEDSANATFFLPLDKLVGRVDNMKDALAAAIDTLAAAVTLFWRLVETPGYIRLDSERLRHLLASAGRGRFAAATAEGPDRAHEVAKRLQENALLTTASGPVRAMLCGVLAGDDLRLSEISTVSETLRAGFNPNSAFDLATVNDEENFGGRLSVVLLLFESRADGSANAQPGGRRHRPSVLGNAGGRGGRFAHADRTEWHGEDLDTPTYLRKNINPDF